MSVRIGLDFRAALAHPCGIARYTRELARGLLDLKEEVELVLYAATRFGSVADRIPRAIREHPRVDLIERRLPAKALRALSFLPGFRLSKITGPLALLHHTDLTYLPVNQVPEVLTVHDLAYEVSADFHGSDFRASVGQRVRRAVDRARVIIVPSTTTRDDLVSRYGVEADRIRVIPHGVDHVLRRPEDVDESCVGILRPDAFPRPYMLHVGTIEPRKNLVRLLRAFEHAVQNGAELDLVLAGPHGWMTEEFDATLAASSVRRHVHLLGAVPESTLRDLYASATMSAYPSLYEGYGLPIVEAMAQGVPVITSNRSSTVEVAAGAAWLVDPEDEAELAHAIGALAADPNRRRQMGEEGQRRTTDLTWKNTARATWNVYRELLTGGFAPRPMARAAVS